MADQTKILLEDLTFPEGPRWHEGRLWFSDFYAHEVIAVDMAGQRETIVKVPGQPSGLGWTPEGRLLVVSMTDRRLLRLDPDGLVEVADLSALANYHCNDMVVDGSGRSYIGSFQMLDELQHPGPGNMPGFSHIILVQPDGSARIVADRMTFPNGPVISPDGRTYIVAETFANRLTAFDIEEDGSLSNRRVWADIGAPTDGITMDEEGCLWVAVPYYIYGGPGGFVRVREGGEIVDRIDMDGYASYACTLGGPQMKTLFLCQSTLIGRERFQGDGRIMVVEVDVPGTGTP